MALHDPITPAVKQTPIVGLDDSLLTAAKEMTKHDVSALIVNGLLTVYLVTGTWLEEQKLIREFGDTYRNYQNRVSMLIPYKWFRKKPGPEQDFF